MEKTPDEMEQYHSYRNAAAAQMNKTKPKKSQAPEPPPYSRELYMADDESSPGGAATATACKKHPTGHKTR